MGLNKACTFFSDMSLRVDVQIQAGWLKGTKALRSLKLEGNLLTSLDSGSFPLKDLRDLESLDVSDNQINHLDRNRLMHISFIHFFHTLLQERTVCICLLCIFAFSHIICAFFLSKKRHKRASATQI